ncbi:MAG: LLM class flavin-dependent oxidoreductase [Thermomicrobiales bacterium]|nr:LLM class flavin-dependent oxidoreductase [Thermomicrobiales bacterium]
MLVSLMIEGALGLNWPRWQNLVRAAEDFGFDGIYRSDHFMGRAGVREDALEAYTSLTWAADHTERIELGTLVSPVSFRDPRILAWQATAINDLAHGRLRIGIGTGWQVQEHDAFGFELGSMSERFDRMEDGLQTVLALTRSDEPVSNNSERYKLTDAQLLPRWPEKQSPDIIIGGNGPQRTMPLAAKYADEWNALKGGMQVFQDRSAQLTELLIAEGRDPKSVRRSQMCGIIFGKDQAALNADPEVDRFEEFLEKGEVVGTPNQVVEILQAKAEAGVEAVVLQWLEFDDIAGLELLASTVLPKVRQV